MQDCRVSFLFSRLEFSLSESQDRIKVNSQVRIILYKKRELRYLVFWFFRFLVTLEIRFRLKEFPHIFSSDFLFFFGLFVFLLFFFPFCHSLFAFMNSEKCFGFYLFTIRILNWDVLKKEPWPSLSQLRIKIYSLSKWAYRRSKSSLVLGFILLSHSLLILSALSFCFLSSSCLSHSIRLKRSSLNRWT